MKRRAFISSLIFCMVFPASAVGFEEIRILNKSPVALNVWFWKAENKEWIKPYITCEPEEVVTVRLADKRYYMAATLDTPDSETFVIGWVDFEKLHLRSEAPLLTLDGAIVTKTKQATYTVSKPVAGTVTTKVPIMRYRVIDGQGLWVEETVTETKKVVRMVSEQRVKTIFYETFHLSPSFSDSQGALTSSVTFKTDKPGAFIKYKLAGRNGIYRSDNPTDSTDKLPVGTYDIWAERNGKPTSKKQRYGIFGVDRTITIPEDVPPEQ